MKKQAALLKKHQQLLHRSSQKKEVASLAGESAYFSARDDLQIDDLICDEELKISEEAELMASQQFAPKIHKIEYETARKDYKPEMAFILTQADDDSRESIGKI